MGFKPSREEQYILMRERQEYYKYIAVYIENLAIESKDPDSIIK